MKAPFTAIMKSSEQTALFLRAVKNVRILQVITSQFVIIKTEF